MINQEALDNMKDLTIEQYKTFTAQHQREATIWEELEFHTAPEALLHYFPSIATNFILVLIALLVFRHFLAKSAGSNKRL